MCNNPRVIKDIYIFLQILNLTTLNNRLFNYYFTSDEGKRNPVYVILDGIETFRCLLLPFQKQTPTATPIATVTTDPSNPLLPPVRIYGPDIPVPESKVFSPLIYNTDK